MMKSSIPHVTQSNLPCVLDLPMFEIGHDWCHHKNPECERCYLQEYCPKCGIDKTASNKDFDLLRFARSWRLMRRPLKTR